MSNVDESLDSLKAELFNNECVKTYFHYKELLDSDPSIAELDKKMRTHQKLMCQNKNNNDVYFQEKSLYEKYKNELENNPIFVNYQIAKEEVFSLLVDIKNILS